MTTELKQASEIKSNYFAHSFNLTDIQIKYIAEAIKSNESVVLQLSKKSFSNGNTILPLTKAEGMNVIKNRSFHYNLSKKKIKLFQLSEEAKEGGILPLIPLIIGGISALGALTGGASAIAKTVIDKNANDARLDEQIRHDKAIESIAKEGNSLYLNPPGYERPNGAGAVSTKPSYKGSSFKEFVNNHKSLDDVGKKTLRSFFKNLSSHMKIEKQGNSLYLSYPQ